MGVLSKGLEGAKVLLDMSRKARMERAREMGFGARDYFHGSPDLRGVREGFSPRTIRARNRRTGEFEDLPQATYVTPDQSVARSYADPERAWDYQNAEEGVLPLRVRDEGLLEIDARGKRFNQLPLERVREQIPESQRAAFDDLVDQYADPMLLANEGSMRTGDLEVIANKLGYPGFRIRNVRDTYSGGGRPTEIVAVYEPSRFRSPEAAFDPSQRDSSNLLAGVGAAAVGAGLLAPQEADAAPVGRFVRAAVKKQGDEGIDTSFRGYHQAPVGPDDASLHEIDKTYPDDIYSPEAIQYYGHGDGSFDERRSFQVMRDVRGKPDAPVKVYRAVPADAPDEILPGDWVTTNPDYARVHGSAYFGDDFKILEGEAPARKLKTEGNSPHEYGYTGFARPGMMAAAGAGGAIAYDPVEARQTARRRREIDELTDTLIRDWQRSVAAPRPETPRFETLAQLSEWARAQRTSGIPLYEQPLASTADTLDRLAYGDYRRGSEGLGTLAADAVFTAAEVFDPATWAALGRQKQQNLINRITSARERANR